MKLYIPHLGDKLTLESDWTFSVHFEHRNNGLTDLMENLSSYSVASKAPGFDYREWGNQFRKVRGEYPKPFTLPAGTILSVERIYIRMGASDYDSITFRVQSSPDERFKKKVRFWVKLDDANKIEFSDVEIAEKPLTQRNNLL